MRIGGRARSAVAGAVAALLIPCVFAAAADLVVLTEENWDEYAPAGKEADCILGDYVLRNDRLVAVVANPELISGRSGGRNPLQAGGGMIDLVARDAPSDQLTLFRLGDALGSTASDFTKGTASYRPDYAAGFTPQHGSEVVLSIRAKPHYSSYCPSETRFILRDGDAFIRQEIEFWNTGAQPEKEQAWWIKRDKAKIEKAIATQEASEGILVEGERVILDKPDEFGLDVPVSYRPAATPAASFVCRCPAGVLLRIDGPAVLRGKDDNSGLSWACDRATGQAYGVWRGGSPGAATLKADGRHKIWCTVFPGRDLFTVRAVACDLMGVEQYAARVSVTGEDGPKVDADVSLYVEGVLYASGRTGADGVSEFRVPGQAYRMTVAPPGHEPRVTEIMIPEQTNVSLRFAADAYVEGEIRAEDGGPVPCKIEFRGLEGTPDPDFAPETAAERVRNLVYTPDGRFRQVLAPGRYQAIITRGPEYDAEYSELVLEHGRCTALNATLRRVVHTPGWISVDLRSRSAWSAASVTEGNPANSPEGRVLNLACEQIDFAPGADHNTVTDYAPLVEKLGLSRWLSTCPGIYLTDGGRKYAFNSQCAFPIEYHPRRQDGGALARPQHCGQIEWLRSWGAPVDPANPWLAARTPRDGYEKLIVLTQPDNKLATVHARDAWMYSSMWHGKDVATFWKDDRALIKPFLRDSDGDRIPDRITFTFARSVDAWDVRTLDGLLDPQAHVANDVLDWLETTRHGSRLPPVVGSTAIDNFHGVGRFRSYVRCPTDDPAAIVPLDVVRAIRAGQVMLTTGPFVELTVETDGGPAVALPGDSIVAEGAEVRVRLRVQAPNWITIDAVEILRNGQPDPALTLRRSDEASPFEPGPECLDRTFAVSLKEDTHFIAIVRGHGPNLRRRRNADDGELGHVAVTAPVYVDLGGNGFTPQPPEDDAIETRLRMATPLRSAAEAKPGRLGIALINHGDRPATDTIRLRFLPEGIVCPVGAGELPFTVEAGASTNLYMDLQLSEQARLDAVLESESVAVSVWLLRSGNPPGLAPSRLRIVVDGGPEADQIEAQEQILEGW